MKPLDEVIFHQRLKYHQHVVDIHLYVSDHDELSDAVTFSQCLEAVKSWIGSKWWNWILARQNGFGFGIFWSRENCHLESWIGWNCPRQTQCGKSSGLKTPAWGTGGSHGQEDLCTTANCAPFPRPIISVHNYLCPSHLPEEEYYGSHLLRWFI